MLQFKLESVLEGNDQSDCEGPNNNSPYSSIKSLKYKN